MCASIVKTVNGNIFRTDAVLTILRNEKYNGDLLMQKTVTVDFLSHKSVKNEGEAPQYYIQAHHEPIIDHETWHMAQNILEIRSDYKAVTGKTGKGRTAGNLGFCYYRNDTGTEIPLKRCSYRFKNNHNEYISAPVWKLPAGGYIKETELISAYERILYRCKEKPEQYIPDNQDNEQTKRNRSLFLSCLDTEEAFTWKAYLPFIQRCVLFEQNAVLYACFETNFQCTLTIAL